MYNIRQKYVHDEKGFLYIPIKCIYEDGRPAKIIKTWDERQKVLKENKYITITTHEKECIFTIHKNKED